MDVHHAPLGLIGGTGLAAWDAIEQTSSKRISTPWGAPSGPILSGLLGGRAICFIARHGPGHRLPPHRINYRANMQALKDAGCTRIVAVAAVGTMDKSFAPGAIALPRDLIDYTWGREHTYSDHAGHALQHVEFTTPYSESLRAELLAAAGREGLECGSDGVMAVTQGPRLESAAEIARLVRDGCSMVGMTGMPEAALARELGMDYVSLAVAVNWAAGYGQGDIHGEIERCLEQGMAAAKRLIRAVLAD